MQASFRVDVGRVRSRLNETVKRKAERITQFLVDGFIERSPVRTGRFRKSWNVSEGMPVFLKIDEVNVTGVLSAPKIVVKATSNFPVFYITNGQPYAQKLEYGSSKQAPYGMVRVTIASLR